MNGSYTFIIVFCILNKSKIIFSFLRTDKTSEKNSKANDNLI